MRRTLASGPIFAALLYSAAVSAQDGAGNSAPRTRVRISGTGNDIVLEREPRPERKPSRASEWTMSPLDSAAELKASGASDEAVLSHLRAHADEIPPVIASEDVRKLRKAGAGPVVIAWLSRTAALDIGETGEGHESPEYPTAPPPQDMTGGYYYDGGYASYGGYGAPYGYPAGRGSFGSRFGRHGRPAVPIHHGSSGRWPAHGNRAIGASGHVHRILR